MRNNWFGVPFAFSYSLHLPVDSSLGNQPDAYRLLLLEEVLHGGRSGAVGCFETNPIVTGLSQPGGLERAGAN